ESIDGRTLKRVEWHRVVLSIGSSMCQLRMFEGPTAMPSTPKPSRDGSVVVRTAGIEKLGPAEFNVDRSLVDDLIERQGDLMKTIRIVPEREADRIVGIRLFGIRADAFPGSFGFANGDRLEKINGLPLTTPEAGLEAFVRLRMADHWTVQINRSGQTV